MSTLTEGRHTGEFILSESPGAISRNVGTVEVPANTTLEAGTVLGQISASGHFAPYDDSASDGREAAAAILIDGLTNDDDAAAELDGVVLDFSAEVRSDDLVWGDGVDEEGGLVDLAALFIKARD
jgi:hypothetical protein